MMPVIAMICIENLEMHYGPQILFADVNLQLLPGYHYGLTGSNGSGKSTFLKILNQREHPSSGRVRLPNRCKIGFLEQDQFKYDQYTLIETVLSGREKLYQAHLKMQELINKESFSQEESDLYSNFESEYAREGGYTSESEAAKMLEGLGLEASRHDQPMETLSGGYKLRVLLARVLFSEPDLLLLDEPTNHLDLYSIRWLELYLKKFPGILVMTTHDREFMNATSTHILELDYGTIRSYKGNYDQYVRLEEESRALREATFEKSEKKKEELQKFVDRFRAKASKARQAQSKAKLIEKLEDKMNDNAFKTSTRRPPRIKLSSPKGSGRVVLKIQNLNKAFGELKVLNNISFELERGEKMAILGPNGIGKSTLLKIITGQTSPDSGKATLGHAVKFSYLPQNLDDCFQAGGSVLTWLNNQLPEESEGNIRKTLGNMLFSGDDAHKSVLTLSGGEKARLLIARIILEQHNLIILDEPTNHLDLEAIDELTRALKNYQGTLLFVSHNRWFVNKLATRILEIKHDATRCFDGGFDTFLEQSTDHLDRNLSLKQRNSAQSDELIPKPERKSNEELKLLRRKLSSSEKEIQSLENKIEKLHQKMSSLDFHEKLSLEERQKSYKEDARLQESLKHTLETWEKLSEELEQ